MRIGIATVQVPFVRGGAEFLAESLLRQLRLAGHEAEIIAVPFKWYPADRIPDHMLACRLLDLAESCHVPIDRVIGLKFPAYMIPHPNMVLWLLHQHRGAYDLWDTRMSDLRHVPNGDHIRRVITEADKRIIPQARACYTISKNVSRRLQQFCGLPSTALYHPPPHDDRFHCDGYDDYILLPSRINSAKRQDLAVKALTRTKHPVKIVFMGPADDPSYGDRLREITASDPALHDRAIWTGSVSDDAKYEYYAKCLAMIFPVFDEDYGYVTLEAMLSAKAVITCADSGGPLEFVRHEQTGLVCPPDPDSIAAALDRLWEDRALAREYGQAGRTRYADLEIGWNRVIDRLTAT